MKLLNLILTFTFAITLFSCEKKLNDLQIERNVLDEVFLDVVDSIYMDRRVILPPPMPRLDFKTNKEDTIGLIRRLTKYKRDQDSIRKDTSKIPLAVYDFAEKIRPQDKNRMMEIYKDSILYDNSKDVKHFKLNLSTFNKKSKKFIFKYSSGFIPDRFWDDSNKSLPVGSISVSRIQFSKNKSSGILVASTSCGGGKCGRGFLIIIENKSGRWKIAKIIHTWLS